MHAVVLVSLIGYRPQHELTVVDIEHHRLIGPDLAGEYEIRQGVLHQLLDGPFERSRSEIGVETVSCQQSGSFF